MTKKELIEQANSLGIEISDPKHTTKEQIEQMISEKSASSPAKTYTRTKSRVIKPTVMAWFDQLGTPDAVDKAEFSEFMEKVLAVCPHWVKRDNENTAKKHFSWYKSTWKKQYNQQQEIESDSE